MAKTETVTVRVDPALKREAADILGGLGLSLSDAVTMCLKQIQAHKGLPFPARLPNQQTIDALNEDLSGRKTHSAEDAIEALNR